MHKCTQYYQVGQYLPPPLIPENQYNFQALHMSAYHDKFSAFNILGYFFSPKGSLEKNKDD